ncbi:MAG TPA: 50S ribosomal protein L11 methyltransferase [Magnetospirillaceae bacterium]
MSEQDIHRAFIRSGTELVAPTAIPEVKLHLATAITPLWQASEAYLHGNNLPPPYWAFAWVGGQALARYVLDSPWLVRGRRVLDFAAGSGICGIAAALAGATEIEASDLDGVACAAIMLNAESNGVSVKVLPGDLVDRPSGSWDVVLAGDICYEKPMTDRCFPWLQELAQKGAMVLLADPGRAYLPEKGIVRLAEYTIPTSREIEDRESRDTVIYRVAG